MAEHPDLAGMRVRVAAQTAAAAVHERITRHHNMSARDVVFATVRVADPLQAELFDEPTVVVEGDELRLTNMLRWWRANFGIAVGDVLVVLPLADEWVAFDLADGAYIDAGVRPTAATSGALAMSGSGTDSDGDTFSVTVHLPVAKKLPVYNEAGALVGYVPVFNPGVLP